MFQVTEQPHDLSRVQFVAADMDNTLLDENGELPEEIFGRVEALSELGVTFAIASGRPLVTLQALFPELRHKIMLIGDNGGVISNKGTIVYQADLPASGYGPMIELAHSRGDSCMLCATETVYFDEDDRANDEVYATFYYERTYVPNLEDVSPQADKFTIYLPEGDSVEKVREVYGPAFGDAYTVASSGPVWIDITPKGMDKGAAMRHVSELLAIPLDNMMAFGDTFNDAEMLKAVGFGYMMANATPGMERYADYVAPSNVKHGVIQVIDQLIAARRA